MNNNQKIAANIVDDLLSDLRGRQGFGDQWDATDRDIQQEIVQDLRRIVEAHLPEPSVAPVEG